MRQDLLTWLSLPSHCRPSEGCRDTTSAPENRADRCWWSGTQTGRWGWAGPWGSTAGGPLWGAEGQRERHVGYCVRCHAGRSERQINQIVCVCVCFVTFLPCTRKQKSFHISRRVSFVNPSASYSTTPLQHTHTYSLTRSYFTPTAPSCQRKGTVTNERQPNTYCDRFSWLTFQSGWGRQRCTLSSCDSLGWHTAPRENKVEGWVHTMEVAIAQQHLNPGSDERVMRRNVYEAFTGLNQ